MTHKVLVNEKIADTGINLLREQFDVTVLPGWDADELQRNIGSFDAIVVRSATKVTSGLIEAADRLKVIGRAGVGVDNVDLDAASTRGVMVVNAPTSTVISAAEHTIALMFAVARNVAQGDATMKAGAWERSKLGGIELSGKTLVVLGLGRIGQLVAERARGLGMRVVGYDPFVARDRFQRLGVAYAASVEEALPLGDVVTLHMPLNDDTRGMMSTAQFAAMKPGSRVINCARGALLDLDALESAIDRGLIAGAGLDVYPVEPPPAHPVFARPEVVLTPHLAASTREAQDRAGIAVAEQVTAALTGGSVTTAVNIPTIAAESVAALQPFVPLTRRLARLATQLAGAPTSTLSVQARGDIAGYDVRMLTYSALIAMLSDTSDVPVTFVNARQIAETRGIDVVESTDAHAADYTDIVELTATGDRTITVSGTTIGADDRAWLTRVSEFTVEIELTEHMAVFRYADVPGMIGLVGSAFGDAGVNIANMAVSRAGGTALMVVSFDAAPPASVMDALAGRPEFEWGTALAL